VFGDTVANSTIRFDMPFLKDRPQRPGAALQRELSAGVRKSEKVLLCYPIMPIADGIGSRLIVNRGHLG